ncbi:hypothetical protein [Cupriavidus sp. CuC1]|uniref:hypothetical protein n=1 Tax=Cupriavidus sp. CuC1 TaxID=3373131 RepID=UPI0037CD6EE6
MRARATSDAGILRFARIEAAGGSTSGHVVDMAERESVAAFFARIPRLDYRFAPGAADQVASIHSDDHDAVEGPFRSKFRGQYHAVHEVAPKIAPDGAIVLSTALGRVGSVHEVADAVLFLFGNGYMTGSTLFVDGGYVQP